jgi:hypothetical protein
MEGPKGMNFDNRASTAGMQRNKFELGFPVLTGYHVDYFIEYSIQRRKLALKVGSANTDNTSGTVVVGECSTFLLNHLDGRVM